MAVNPKVVDAQLYLEGVRIPFTSVQLNIVPNAPSSAVVNIPPYPSAKFIQPRTSVHIFFYDENTSDELDEDERYKLMFEGEVAGYSYNKTPEGRSIALTCIDYVSYWTSTYVAFGRSDTDFLVNQNQFIVSGVVGQGDPRGSFGNALGVSQNEFAFYMSQQGDNPVHAVREVFRNSCLINPFFLLANGRNEFSEKLISLTDPDILRLYSGGLASSIRRIFSGRFALQQTTFDVMRSIMATIQYEMVSNPVASYLPAIPPPLDDARDVGIGSFILKPSTLFTAPPLCNVVYPDQHFGMQFSRSFLDEPTRVRVSKPPVFGNATPIYGGVYLAGGDISTAPNGAVVSELSPVEQQYNGNPQAFYGYLTKEEKIKGIIPRFSDISAPLAVALETSPTRSASDPRVSSDTGPSAGQEKSSDGEGLNKEEQNRLWRQVSAYEYQKVRHIGSAMQISMEFNPNLVCGFPMLVINPEGSYYAEIIRIVHSLDTNGAAMTTVTCQFAVEAEYNSKDILVSPYWLSDKYKSQNSGEEFGAYQLLFGMGSVWSGAKAINGSEPPNLRSAAKTLLDEWINTAEDARQTLIINRTRRKSIATRKQIFDLNGATQSGENYVNGSGISADQSYLDGDVADYVIKRTFPSLVPPNPDEKKSLKNEAPEKLETTLPNGVTVKADNVRDLGTKVKDQLVSSLGPFLESNKKIAEKIAEEAAQLVFTEEDFVEALRLSTVVSGNPNEKAFVQNESEGTLTDADGKKVKVKEEPQGATVDDEGSESAPIVKKGDNQ